MKYINSAIRMISLIAGGAIFGIVTLSFYLLGVARPWGWGMIFGALFAMGAAAVLGLINYRENVKFQEARNRVEGTILEFSLATLRNFGRSRRAYVFLTADHLRVFLWDKRPYMETTISRNDVTIRYNAAHPDFLTIVYEDQDTLEFVFPSAKELIAAMRQNGYRVQEETGHVR